MYTPGCKEKLYNQLQTRPISFFIGPGLTIDLAKLYILVSIHARQLTEHRASKCLVSSYQHLTSLLRPSYFHYLLRNGHSKFDVDVSVRDVLQLVHEHV